MPMPIKSLSAEENNVIRVLRQKTNHQTGELSHLVKKFIDKKDIFLKLAEKYQTPFYVLDSEELNKNILEFQNAFSENIKNSEYFYAIKINHHSEVIKAVLKYDYGLDVSSERELKLALKSGAKKIVFSGPGKTESSLSLAAKHSDIITVNIDSFTELNRLKKVLAKEKAQMRAGVRITLEKDDWNKFGIPLKDLKKFMELADKTPGLLFEGIHYHLSWNKDALPYQNAIKKISEYLKGNMEPSRLKRLKFIDLGGGFRPYSSEGYYPWITPEGQILKTAYDHLGLKPPFKEKYYLTEAITIEEYAQGISAAIKKYFNPLLNCVYYFEPGRVIANNAMHVILKIMDVKTPQKSIADGGINITGWERFEYDYCPLINLTHPSHQEIDHTIYGSLCMPQDLWGYHCYAKKISEGDIIIVPYQGALTYSLAQNFIHPIPKVYTLK
ncbi:hypothetical protein COT99_03760 [Candidatus Falkowbacteria bacterium CG10_big_fil_rev_8_21_14_0_10_43_10]|uniref:Orn/DAP/Arg decarboxylase 2 N-terminal domain-containing protein n=1 Tax=Candidatus Falkowbacteria bacterium CG10_big_fil_rev_8_21_14_0_10_43_10 TaxID=1974567 RepID=A0A2H0V1B8_9BACT|nr:MAG: hypothetical protein COT99_03760 [Candidatus Falkowbacteria bacterium CG10_big_fil_rev_8_21_14_0_10_43_10]